MPDDSHQRGDAAVIAHLRAMPVLTPLIEKRDILPSCKMCNSQTRHFASVDFNKSCDPDHEYRPSGVSVRYFRCTFCEFMFTSFFDEWSSSDYLDLIYNHDYVQVDGEFTGARARRTAADLKDKLSPVRDGRVLDYGAGSGLFGEELRRHGFAHVESCDPYTMPDRPSGRFDVITCFDAIEHSAQPTETLGDMLDLMADDGCLLVGQTLQPADIEEIRGDWWYLAPRNGHVSLFSEETIREFADRNGLTFENFGDMFALMRGDPSSRTRQIIALNDPVDRRIVIAAPGDIDGEPFGWHSLERDGQRAFRWTNKAVVSLGDVIVEGEVELAVPVFMPLHPRYLKTARLEIGETIVPLDNRRGKWLTARFHADCRTRYPVRLMTSEPSSPDDLGDHRKLGIAVLVQGAQP